MLYVDTNYLGRYLYKMEFNYFGWQFMDLIYEYKLTGWKSQIKETLNEVQELPMKAAS